MKVCWLSAGVSSFVAGYLSKADLYIYIDVSDQHPDSIRFIKDCETVLGKEIIFLRSQIYENVNDVFYRKRFIRSNTGACCTQALKKSVRKSWELDFLKKYGIDEFYKLTYVWGFDVNEKHRADRVVQYMPEFTHEFPLIDKGMSKESVHGFFENNFSFKRPLMYDLGYSNNNCIGCVKGGMGYWNKIRIDFPKVFKERSECERDIGFSILKECYLDELDPDRGNFNTEVFPQCDILCFLASSDSNTM